MTLTNDNVWAGVLILAVLVVLAVVLLTAAAIGDNLRPKS
jgi:hypothetical protein